tara:strand:- start:176 stop:724 length:549 start_codon:yes stop_codon:yes gene_type:complete
MEYLEQFKKSIEKELINRLKEKVNSTPILDRLQIHFDSLEENTEVGYLLTEQNMKSNNFLSLLYQVVYPVSVKRIPSLFLNNKEIVGSNTREKLQNLIVNIGSKKVSTLPNYSKFLFKTKSINHQKNISRSYYKQIDNDYSFDVSMGDINITNELDSLSNEIKEHLNLNIEYKVQTIYKYNK